MRKPDETMMPSRITDELAYQYDNLFHVLSVTIRGLSRKQWTAGDSPFQTPARLACHIVWACEGHATGDWDGCLRRFGCPVQALDEEIPAEQLPTIEQVLGYIEQVHAQVKTWLSALDDEHLLDRTPNWGWRERGMSLLGHVIYVLRHATLHLGHLQMEIHARGIQSGVFK